MSDLPEDLGQREVAHLSRRRARARRRHPQVVVQGRSVFTLQRIAQEKAEAASKARRRRSEPPTS